MSQLHTLNLSYNQLTGSIPSSLIHLKACSAIYLDHNRMTGSLDILSNAGTDLSSLIQLNLSNNFFAGTISMNSISQCMPSLNLFDVSCTNMKCKNKKASLIRFKYY